MAELIAIDQDLVIAHAARVNQVASDVSIARDAASSTNMGGGAFGVLCAFLVPPATVTAQMAGSAIAAAEAMVRRSAVEARGMATDMAAFEEELSSSLAAIESSF